MPLTGLTRRRIPYADIIRAEAPMAKNAYFARLARDQAKKAALARNALAQKTLTQQASQAEDLLAANKEQFRTGLTESQRQFQEQQRLQQEQAAQQAVQAQQATGLATVGLGVEAYPYLKEGASGLSNMIFADAAPAATAGTAAGTTAGTTAGTGAAAGGGSAGAGGAGSGGLGAGGIAGIAALAALGQIAAANSGDPVEGQKAGHFFSTDEQGRWSPWLSEPDKNYFSQQLGGGPTTGAKFDAAIQRGDMGRAAARFPGFAHDYAIPGLSVAGNVVGDYSRRQLGDKYGSQVHTLIDPIGNLTRKIGDAKDIGEAGHALVDTATEFVDPIGNTVGNLAEDTVTNWTGNETLGKAARVFVDPVGSAVDFISNWW
jgi:hypothetical protein